MEIDLNKLIQQAIFQGKEQSRYDQVRITTRLDPLLPQIMADRVQLETVVINLMMNAADAMPDGGEMIISTRRAGDSQVVLELTDDGVGISVEDQAKLFTPFFTTKPPGRGTGLGLSIVYGIIKMHGGQIIVESELGQGTSFYIYLPVKNSATQSYRGSPIAIGEN